MNVDGLFMLLDCYEEVNSAESAVFDRLILAPVCDERTIEIQLKESIESNDHAAILVCFVLANMTESFRLMVLKDYKELREI